MEKQYPQWPIKRFRTDNGTEYTKLNKFFVEKGIIHELTPPYQHESVGIPERFNRIIQTMVRAMLAMLMILGEGLDKRL